MKQLSQYFFVGGGWLVAAFVSLFGTQVWPTLCLVFGLLSLVGGLVYGWRFLQAVLNLQPRRSRPQPVGNGRNVPMTAHGKTRWLSLQSVAPMFGLKPKTKYIATAAQFYTTQWTVHHHLYAPLRTITEPRLAELLQWIFERQCDGSTCGDAASRSKWLNRNPLQPDDQIAYHCMIGMALKVGVLSDWGRSKVLTRSPHWAMVRAKSLLPEDEVIEV